jgi:hypothetical protein
MVLDSGCYNPSTHRQIGGFAAKLKFFEHTSGKIEKDRLKNPNPWIL